MKRLTARQLRSIQVWKTPREAIPFDVINPADCDIDIRTIAHALSNICRFNGHMNRFYSVAQHSVFVSMVVHQKYALQGLLHDASEAYLGDVAYPLKRFTPMYKLYRVVERDVQDEIEKRFGVLRTKVADEEVHMADMLALAYEKRDLLPGGCDEIWEDLPQLPEEAPELVPLSPHLAEASFLRRFHDIKYGL